jgi:hypothetical protein
MKPPYRWRKAIAPAAYDALFFLAAFAGFAFVLPAIVRSLHELWSGRPLTATVLCVLGVIFVVYGLLELRMRLLLLAGVMRIWRRQRTGTWPGGRPLRRHRRRRS